MTRPFPKRAIHLDFHTMPRVHDVGLDFDPEAFSKTLADSHVDYVTVFAKCNLGFAYYPTKVGTVHPGMKVPDLLGPMVDACHRRGISVAAYVNAGLDHERALRRRDWCKVDKQGRVYRMAEMGHFFRPLCLNTDYRQNVLGMVEEILKSYPVDGIFLDCFDHKPCYGVECVDAMAEKGMDVHDDVAVTRHYSLVTDRFVSDAEEIVARLAPGIYLCHNGVRYSRQPTHVELEVLPTGGWGYDYLPLAIRYTRTLGKPYFTMTGRFQKSWGDLGGLRPEHSLLFDCYYSISNGGTCSIGDHMHPRGRLDPAVYDLVGRTYGKIMEIEPWIEAAKPEAEVLVLDPRLVQIPDSNGYPFARGSGLQGAARMLSELKCQFDLGHGGQDLSRYRVIVLADDVPVDPPLARELRAHLDRGGFIISSAWAGLNPEGTAFALDDYRLACEGPEPWSYTFFRALPALGPGLPQMLTTVYTPGIAMAALPGAQLLADLYQPYFNMKEWDLHHEHLYCPPDKPAGRPALARSGNVFHFSFPVFRGYIQHAVIAYRQLVGRCLELALPAPLVKVENLPSFAQVTVGSTRSQRLVHLLAYVPELRGGTQIIEEPILATNVRVSLRVDGGDPKRAYLAPSRQPLELTRAAGYVTVVVPEVRGYGLVVFEE